MIIKAYDRQNAVEYARRWAFDRNPAYYDFEHLGGDCTNFASQCIYAGSGVMNFTPITGWFYISANNRTASWTGVKYLYTFLVNNQGVGPFAKEVDARFVQPGDIVQLSFDGVNFAHSPVVVATGPSPAPSNILVAAHTFDAYNRPLLTYPYKKIRYVHIEGIRTN
ncbi:MAG: amidase domain-containing protein [Eubacteriales bacterium]|jgi:hypothetical protein|nr:amidase domain-containing protein [Eubacteriales bacterium]